MRETRMASMETRRVERQYQLVSGVCGTLHIRSRSSMHYGVHEHVPVHTAVRVVTSDRTRGVSCAVNE